jgi:hypothetical protein
MKWIFDVGLYIYQKLTTVLYLKNWLGANKLNNSPWRREALQEWPTGVTPSKVARATSPGDSSFIDA